MFSVLRELTNNFVPDLLIVCLALEVIRKFGFTANGLWNICENEGVCMYCECLLIFYDAVKKISITYLHLPQSEQIFVMDLISLFSATHENNEIKSPTKIYDFTV